MRSSLPPLSDRRRVSSQWRSTLRATPIRESASPRPPALSPSSRRQMAGSGPGCDRPRRGDPPPLLPGATGGRRPVLRAAGAGAIRVHRADSGQQPARKRQSPSGRSGGARSPSGRGRRVHVAWNGSGEAEPRNPFGGSPLLYTRLNEPGTAFEPQRNVMQRTSALDGGGTVAAGADGVVLVAWHGRSEDDAPDEMGRRLWVPARRTTGRPSPPRSRPRDAAPGPVPAAAPVPWWTTRGGPTSSIGPPRRACNGT